MTPFKLAPYTSDESKITAKELAQRAGCSKKDAQRAIDAAQMDLIYVNDVYQVAVSFEDGHPNFGSVICLSIKRRDREPIHDWRDLQRIKNELTDPEYEAIEIYPAESRLVDAANQYWLWVFADREFRIPLGFWSRCVDDKPLGKSVNRPFET